MKGGIFKNEVEKYKKRAAERGRETNQAGAQAFDCEAAAEKQSVQGRVAKEETKTALRQFNQASACQDVADIRSPLDRKSVV